MIPPIVPPKAVVVHVMSNEPPYQKKLPYLVDRTEVVRERGAIILFSRTAFPDAKLGSLPDEPLRVA